MSADGPPDMKTPQQFIAEVGHVQHAIGDAIADDLGVNGPRPDEWRAKLSAMTASNLANELASVAPHIGTADAAVVLEAAARLALLEQSLRAPAFVDRVDIAGDYDAPPERPSQLRDAIAEGQGRDADELIDCDDEPNS